MVMAKKLELKILQVADKKISISFDCFSINRFPLDCYSAESKDNFKLDTDVIEMETFVQTWIMSFDAFPPRIKFK